MKEKIYAALSNMNRGYAYGLLWVLSLFNFNVFAWSQFLDIVNHSAAPIYITYKGYWGNAWGPCGENYKATPSACAIAAGSLITLKLTQTAGSSDGTIVIKTEIGKGTYEYNGDINDASLDLIEGKDKIGKLASYVQTHTDGPCTTTRYNCIIYTYP